jgi:glycerol-3-phosphate acyltransferase PlsY
VFAPFYQLLIWGGGPVAVAVAVMGLLLVWRHRANIQKLLNGTESRIGAKSKPPTAAATAPHAKTPAHRPAAKRHHGIKP